MRWVDEIVEHRLQRGGIAAVRGHAGSGVPRGIHADPVDVMPGVMGELGDERPLSAAVALPERVQRFEVGQELRQPRAEPRPRQALLPIGDGQPVEHLPRRRTADIGAGNTSPLAIVTVLSSPAQS